MNERYLQQALSAISVRRNNAQTIQQQHLAEIAQTVPEIMEINQQLFHTSQDLSRLSVPAKMLQNEPNALPSRISKDKP